ncbi:uncharacterized protein LOC108217192 [Daucus carota subsp. sativus]|uniref:uncharacterized protein LOC108217192 n=1 Tax=Daucus carota subsp. sativus TaxID=79200 RepID=UPI0007EFBCDB|nr:PREDICTED: uncharacterized protein LOC108217192 [Daucus carota subsp. sativus]
MDAANSEKISLKLLVDRNENKVIFGEAGKDFVDFLFYVLTLPVGTVVTLLSKEKMVGSLGKIYESIESMQDNYMQPDLNKDHVLHPNVYSKIELGDTALLLGNERKGEQLKRAKYLYRCSSGCAYASDKQVKCTNCGRSINSQMTYVKSEENEEAAEVRKGGFVQDLVTYMVMDNLVVKPMSNVSCVTLLSNCGVKDLGALETVEVSFGKNEKMDLDKRSPKESTASENPDKGYEI